MKEKMFKNLSLKILSAIFAVVLWTVIVNVYEPRVIHSVMCRYSLLIQRV